MTKISNKAKILFIDDSQTEIKYLNLLFQISDFPAEPIFINSALVALEFLDTLLTIEFPDVIIVDINMPLMNGFEFANKYLEKFHPLYPKTSLFIYSTSINSADIRKAESISSVKGFISKPFDEKNFNNIILPCFDHKLSIKS